MTPLFYAIIQGVQKQTTMSVNLEEFEPWRGHYELIEDPSELENDPEDIDLFGDPKKSSNYEPGVGVIKSNSDRGQAARYLVLNREGEKGLATWMKM